MKDVTIIDSLYISLLGLIIVFLVLILLMFIIMIMSKIIKAVTRTKAPAVAIDTPLKDAAETDVYTGVKLNGVDERTAAILMAITADSMAEDPDNLRFISIREVK